MRKFLFLMAVVVVASACGGSGTDVVAEQNDSAATSNEAPTDTTNDVLTELEALPPLVSVPVGDYTTGHVNPPVEFDTSPSTGGDHYQFWQNCGFYTVPVIEGAATHTLEHGAVWITYNELAMSPDDLAVLETLAAGNGKLLISPYEHDDFIVLSAWGVQQRGVREPSSPDGTAQITEFIDAWVDNPELVEAGVRCDGAAGLPPEDARSFPDGVQVPAEFG